MNSVVSAERRVVPCGNLQEVIEQGVAHSRQTFASVELKPDELAVTVADLSDPAFIRTASYRGDAPIYPASVVKLFYLHAAHRWLEDGLLQDTPELRRAMQDMIVDSSNDATHYVVDLLTNTTSGPELSPDEMIAWEHKRNAINRHFKKLGYSKINLNQKPWSDGPYGRERIFQSKDGGNRNALTTNATAELLAEIVLGRAVTPERSREMLALMKRERASAVVDVNDQAHGFIAGTLPEGVKVWSKAGWTSRVRHDAAYLEWPDGSRFVVVVFTVNHADRPDVLKTVARTILNPLPMRAGASRLSGVS